MKFLIKCSFILFILLISHHCPGLSSFLIYMIAIAIASIFGIYFGIKFNQKTIIEDYGKNHLVSSSLRTSNGRSNSRKTDKVVENYFQTRTLVSANVDQLMEQMTDYCLRDFVFVWYKDLVNENNDETIDLLK